jgi:arabinofuranosyltransferase
MFFAVVLLRTAWVCDDAYITLRTVDNFTNGHGLRWNVAERVQTYTHPLWMFTLSAVYYFTQEAFFTAIAVSVLVSVAAVAVLLFAGVRSFYWGWLALTALVFSQAFVDYSTSGLENPLTHLLLAVFIAVLLRRKPGFGKLFSLALLAALGMTNRMDNALLFAPALLVAWWEGPRLKGLLALGLGFTPFVLWEAFSLAYYGFFVPNTAFAKLGTGLSSVQLMQQGLYYLLNALLRDTLTIAVIVAGLALALLRGNVRVLALAAGMVLYVLYVIRVGGDFMSGRFFTAPFFVGVAILTCYSDEDRARWCGHVAGWSARWAPPALAGLLTVAAAWMGLGLPIPGRAESAERPWAKTTPTVFSGADYGDSTRNFRDPHGIGDERRFYYRDSGLLRYTRNAELPSSRFVSEGKAFRAVGRPLVRRAGSVGFRGYFGGPDVHLVDYYALGDPLLARLPALYNPDWRIGHFSRTVPVGYEETLGALQKEPAKYLGHASAFEGMPWQWAVWGVLARAARSEDGHHLAAWPLEQNRIADPKLARYFDQLVLVTRGPLWGRARWEAIWKLNTGQYDFLIDRDAHRFAGMATFTLADVARNSLSSRAGLAVGIRGVEISLGEIRHATLLTMTLGRGETYRVELMREGERVAGQAIGPSTYAQGDRAEYQIAVMPAWATAGYDAVRVLPVRGGKDYRLHNIELAGDSPGLAVPRGNR